MKTASLVCITAMSVASGVLGDTIVLGADEWCPYNCDPNSDRPGYMVEVAREALAPYGHTVEYRTVAWARALVEAESGEINGVFGAIPSEAPTFVFGPPIGTYEESVAFRLGELPDVVDADTIQGLRIGAINGYEYYGPISEYIEQYRDDRRLVQYASGDDALLMNLRKLQANRVDAVAEVRAVLEYSIAQFGFDGQFDVLDTDHADDIFIAFSPALETSDLYAVQLSEGVALLKSNGRFQEILESYGLTGPAD